MLRPRPLFILREALGAGRYPRRPGLGPKDRALNLVLITRNHLGRVSLLEDYLNPLNAIEGFIFSCWRTRNVAKLTCERNSFDTKLLFEPIDPKLRIHILTPLSGLLPVDYADCVV